MKLSARQSDTKPVPNFKGLLRENVRLAGKAAPGRKQVENFVHQLADGAAKDRNTLLCWLNRYSQPEQEGAA